MTKQSNLKLLLGLFISLTITSCVTTQVANLQRTSDKEVVVFTTTKPDKEYVELKYIQADGAVFHSSEKLLKKLTERAKNEGADAIINVRYDYQFWWPYVSGTAIKYK
jgi:hypothetical protein